MVRAPADGYTLLLIGPPAAINVTLYDNLSFNFIRDIAPVAAIVRVPFVVMVDPSFPAKTMAEFIAYAKANLGKLSVATPGNGTGPEMAGELFKLMAGIDMLTVRYRGDAPSLTGLMGGQVQVYFCAMPSGVELVKAGKLRLPCGDHRGAGGWAARRSHLGRTAAGFRSKLAFRGRCAKRYANGHHRQAQQCDQCHSRRSQIQGAARRAGQCFAGDGAR